MSPRRGLCISRGEPHAIAFSRPLTAGERGHADAVFGAAIDCDRIRIHAHRAYLFQPADTAMAPDGHIYFPRPVYRADFAADLRHAAWLVHELTHVWQHQHGRWVRLLGIVQRRYRYGDLGTAARPFARYGIEQQAAIVEDAFRLRHGLPRRYGSGAPDDYRRVIPFRGATT